MQINTCYNEVCRQASLKAQHVEPELKMVINQLDVIWIILNPSHYYFFFILFMNNIYLSIYD